MVFCLMSSYALHGGDDWLAVDVEDDYFAAQLICELVGVCDGVCDGTLHADVENPCFDFFFHIFFVF